MNVVQRVKDSIIKHQLLTKGDTVVVAVSGGPDSVTLLHVLKQIAKEWEISLIVAHVDHRFRGEISAEEAKGVKALAIRWGLPYVIEEIDVPAHIRMTGQNAQDAARQLRYEFLIRIAERYHAERIALGHHADDHAETILMNMLRGAGADGLEGIPIRRKVNGVELIRPLLGIGKSEILQYCVDHQLGFYLDQSNQERKYFRNQIRLDVLPYLQRFNPRLTASLTRMAETISADNDYIQGIALQIFSEKVHLEKEACRFTRNLFLAHHVALQRRLIKLILNYLSVNQRGFDFQIIETIREAIIANQPTTSKLDIGAGLTFLREYDNIMITAQIMESNKEFAYVVKHVPNTVSILELDYKMEFMVLDAGQPQSTDSRERLDAFFDLDQLYFPLTVRTRIPGDRIQLPGISGSKKIKDLFIDLKIPPSLRGQIPLIADARGDILWIPGVRQSKLYSVHANTDRILHISCNKFIQ